MCYTPVKYELLWVNENAIRIDLHVFNNECRDILCITIRYDDFFNADKYLFSDYSSAKEAHNDFCEYIKECMELYDDCPDADFEKVKGYKTVYKKVCLACKAIITDMWGEEHDKFSVLLSSARIKSTKNIRILSWSKTRRSSSELLRCQSFRFFSF